MTLFLMREISLFSYLFRCKLSLLIFCVALVLSNEYNTDPNKENENLFKRLFKLRRVEQLEAVKKMRKLQEDKQHKMVKTISKTIFEVILKSRVVLESSGYVPGVSEFPEKEAVRDALSLVLENTALMGEMVLRLPEVMEPVLRSTSEWPVLLAWSLTFANQTQLLDNSTATLFSLVGQELNLSERSPDYINPYRQVTGKAEQGKDQTKKKKKKTETPRGPRLSLRQVGEL